MPDEELMRAQRVTLIVSLEKIISRPGVRVNCDLCGEEIMNEREVPVDDRTLCKSCAGMGYVEILPDVSLFQEVSSSVRNVNIRKAYQYLNIPLVTIIGQTGSGKTTLIEKLIVTLKQRGYKLATVKHHSHRGFEIDEAGKDSWRFAQAGSDHVIIASPDKIASYRKTERALDLDEITAGVSDVDLILVEGYKQAEKPALEVLRAANSREPIGSPEQRFAIAADFPLDLDVPQFALNDAQGITDLIETLFLNPS